MRSSIPAILQLDRTHEHTIPSSHAFAVWEQMWVVLPMLRSNITKFSDACVDKTAHPLLKSQLKIFKTPSKQKVIVRNDKNCWYMLPWNHLQREYWFNQEMLDYYENDRCSRFWVYILIYSKCMLQSIEKITGNIIQYKQKIIMTYVRNDNRGQVLRRSKRKFELFPVKYKICLFFA